MLLVENRVYKYISRQLNIWDQEFIECEWIYLNRGEQPVDDEPELLVDFEKLTRKG